MKKGASIKKLSLPTTVAIAVTSMIALMILFCGACASLILKGIIKNTDLKIAARIFVAFTSFVGVKFVIRNNAKYLTLSIFTACMLLLMLIGTIILKINIGNFVIIVLFVMLGVASGVILDNIKPKKSRFQKKRYR